MDEKEELRRWEEGADHQIQRVKEVLQNKLNFWMEQKREAKTNDFDGIIEEICDIADELYIKLE